MKVTISLFSKGQEHAYKYELELEDGQELPVVVSPSKDVNRVFIQGVNTYGYQGADTEYHEATYDFCMRVHEAPDVDRIKEAELKLVDVPTWTPPEE
jgi:hypothetical protein